MPRPSSVSARSRKLIYALVLALLCLNGPLACTPRKASAPRPVAVGADIGNAAAVAQTSAPADGGDEATETCEGALDCTFFGLGAVLAAPFWVLGVVLGLAF